LELINLSNGKDWFPRAIFSGKNCMFVSPKSRKPVFLPSINSSINYSLQSIEDQGKTKN
jgi:hypothetical protein